MRFTDHPVLGNLELDFHDASGDVPSTVVIAGENGSGKTLVLNAIYSMLGDIDLDRAFDMEIELEIDAQAATAAWVSGGQLAPRVSAGDVLTITLSRKNDGASWSQFRISHGIGFGDFPSGRNRPITTYLSEAESAYSPGEVQAVGATGLDQGGNSRRAGRGLGAEISQLLVDIGAADAEDLARWVRAHPGEAPPADQIEPRMDRFRDAISYLMPHKQLAGIDRGRGNLSVRFEEAGRPQRMDQLSTGEKQVVIRGGFVLRDLDQLQGGIVLVDEPDLGLHPAWQGRILGFYERLFPATPQRSTQLIVATHSPFIVHEQAHAKVIILRKDANGEISVDPDPRYPTTGQARVVNALNVPALIGRAERDTIVLVEGTTDDDILSTAWRRLRTDPMPFSIRPVLAESQIRTTLSDDQLFVKNPNKKIVGLFDFDSAYHSWNGVWRNNTSHMVVTDPVAGLTKKHDNQTGWAALLPVPLGRAALASVALAGNSALSIELMFEDQYHLAGMIEQLPLPAAGATVPRMRNNMKTDFARHVVGMTDVAPFQPFEPLLQLLEQIVGGHLN